MRYGVAAVLVLTAACGPKRPPPTFAPDPGLVEQIREIRMSTATSACPGESFFATYTAVLNDGSLVPFETRRRFTCSPTRAPSLHLTGSSSRLVADGARAARKDRRASRERTDAPAVPAAPEDQAARAATAATVALAVAAGRLRSSHPRRSRSWRDSWMRASPVV